MYTEPTATRMAEARRMADEALARKGQGDHPLGALAKREDLAGDRDRQRLVQAIAHNVERTRDPLALSHMVGSHLAMQNDAHAVLAVAGVEGYDLRKAPTPRQREEAARIAGRPELIGEAVTKASGRFQDLSELSQRPLMRQVREHEAGQGELRELRALVDEQEKRAWESYGAEMRRTFATDPRVERGEDRSPSAMGDAAFRDVMVAMGTRAVAMASWPRAEAAGWFGHDDPDAIDRRTSGRVVPFEHAAREKVMMAWLVEDRRRNPGFDDAYAARIETPDRELAASAARRGMQPSLRDEEHDRALMVGREKLVETGIPPLLRSREEPEAMLPRHAVLDRREIGAGIAAMRADLGLEADDALQVGATATPRALAAQFLYHTLPIAAEGRDGRLEAHAGRAGHLEMSSAMRSRMGRGDASAYSAGLAAVEDMARWKSVSPEASRLFAENGSGSWARATAAGIADRKAEGVFVDEVLTGRRVDFAGDPRPDAPVRRQAMAGAAMARGAMSLVR